LPLSTNIYIILINKTMPVEKYINKELDVNSDVTLEDLRLPADLREANAQKRAAIVFYTNERFPGVNLHVREESYEDFFRIKYPETFKTSAIKNSDLKVSIEQTLAMMVRFLDTPTLDDDLHSNNPVLDHQRRIQLRYATWDTDMSSWGGPKDSTEFTRVFESKKKLNSLDYAMPSAQVLIYMMTDLAQGISDEKEKRKVLGKLQQLEKMAEEIDLRSYQEATPQKKNKIVKDSCSLVQKVLEEVAIVLNDLSEKKDVVFRLKKFDKEYKGIRQSLIGLFSRSKH
jgi:hypothetical protein